MNKLKKLLLISIIYISFTGCYTEFDKEQIQVTGIVLSAENFKNCFTGEPTDRVTLDSVKWNNASLELSDITMHESQIHFKAIIIVNDKPKELLIKGKLSKSIKTQHGINSTIIEVDSNIEGYEILLFEICNDPIDSKNTGNLLIARDLISNNPYMKIYIKDERDNIYLFESEVPQVFSELKASDYTDAYKMKDALLWAYPYAK